MGAVFCLVGATDDTNETSIPVYKIGKDSNGRIILIRVPETHEGSCRCSKCCSDGDSW